MKSRGRGRIVLIDENATVCGALKSYLQKGMSRSITTLRSISQLDGSKYDTVFLNLSYCISHMQLIEKIRKMENQDFNQLVVFSNLCLYKYQLAGLDERVTVLCKRSLWNLDRAGSRLRLAELQCGEECDDFESAEPDVDEDLNRRLHDLSRREKEILGMIARGFSSKEIGEELFISKRTVDFHRANILRKMDVSGLPRMISLAASYLAGLTESGIWTSRRGSRSSQRRL